MMEVMSALWRQRTWILEALLKEILCETVARLSVATPLPFESAAATFLQSLIALPHVHADR